jgi:outer membrane lipoprotein carrier protein
VTGALLAVSFAAVAVFPGRALAGAQAQLREFVNGTSIARGEFTQRSSRSAGQRVETASGVFAFSRPGRFRWEVRKPFEQLMVADGERLYFFDRDLNQVTIRKLSGALGATPAAILFGSNELERAFTVRDTGPQDGLEWLEAVPKSRDAGFEQIRIGFRTGLPEAMEVVDSFGGTTRFTFRGLERGVRLEPETFRFVVPKGADVIQE